jgi:microcystin-dependent protein
MPAGTVLWFAGNSAPTGWLYCDGTILLIDAYTALYAAIGRTYTGPAVPSNSFRIPELRGQFIRGWDNRATGGVDNGRVFGSYQLDEFKSHTHTYKDNLGPGYGLTFTGNSAEQDSQTGAAGGSETRPKNMALLPIIKT